MEILIPDNLLKIISIALMCSIIQTAFLQKVKELAFMQKGSTTWGANFILSFILGELFSIYFFGMNLIGGAWVGLITFIGASGIYESVIKLKTKKTEEPQ